MDNTEMTQEPEVVNQAVDTHEKKTPQESFADLRRQNDDLKRQVWQANKEKELFEQAQYRQAQMMQQQTQQTPEEDFDYRQLEQEEFPEGKKLVKAFNSFNKKLSDYDKKLAEKDQKIQMLEASSANPDFKDVVTEENIKKYILSDEDNRESVEKAANPLRKVYNLIKKDARYQADIASKTKKPTISQEQQRVDEKEGKPKTGSIGVRSEAVSTAAAVSNSKMTKEQKNALWAETQKLARK